jgi:hypothetical protein
MPYIEVPLKKNEDLHWRNVFQYCLQGKSIHIVIRKKHCGEAVIRDVVSIQDKHGPSHKPRDQEELIVLQFFLDKSGIYLERYKRSFLISLVPGSAVQHYAEQHSDLAYQDAKYCNHKVRYLMGRIFGRRTCINI